MLKDTTREAEIDAVETPQLLQLLPALAPKKKPVAFARIRTLHGLLKVALDDFEAVLAQPDVAINMDTWVRPMRKSGRCSVCLAGSVMYRQYGIRSLTTEWDMGEVYGNAVEDRLEALNELRIGYVTGAWHRLHSDTAPLNNRLRRDRWQACYVQQKWVERLHKFTYARSGRMSPTKARAFLDEMRAMQKDLKGAGL